MKWMATLAMAGCGASVPKVAITGDELLRHATELARDDQAQLATRRIGQGAERAEGREQVFLYQTVLVDGQTTTVERVLAGCAGLPGATCRVTPATRIVVRDVPDNVLADERAAVARSDNDGCQTNACNKDGARVAGALALISLGAIGACALSCGDARETGMIIGGVSALVFGVGWAIMSGGRD